MIFWQEESRRKARIEIIPMIDVMMFLMVFFVLISLHVIPATGIKTVLPSSSHTDNIDAVHHAVITIGKSDVVQIDGRDCSLASLPEKISALLASFKKMDVVINGDKGADMQKLVDVMDAVKNSGITAISIAASKK